MQITRRTFAATSLLAGFTPLAHAYAQATPEATPAPSEMQQRVQAVLNTYGVPGAVVAVTTPFSESAEVRTFGMANVQTQEPILRDMHFRIASVTKTFVSTVVLQLVDERLLMLDDVIADILPDLQVPQADRVTVRNLLNMRSGLPQLADNPDYVEIILLRPEGEMTVDQIFALVANLPARAEPDTVFEYNNLNFDILGEMIRTVTGTPWYEHVQQRICEPLGLANTMMITTPNMPVPYARGYGYLDQDLSLNAAATAVASPVTDMATPAITATPVNDAGLYDLTAFNPTIAGAAGGLISTIADQMVWANALGTGELLSKEMHTAQITALPMAEGSSIGYGLGIININGLIAHNGGINGYQSVIASLPELGVTLAVLTNANPTLGNGDAAFEIAATLLT